MKYTIAVAALALWIPMGSAARAADMPVPPVKAKLTLTDAYPAGSGFYFGVGSFGGGGPANITAPGVNSASLVTNQASIGGILGYAWNVPNSKMFAAVEAFGGYTNLNGEAAGLSFTGPAVFKERFLTGAPLDQIASFFPTWGLTIPTLPILPPGQAVVTAKPYIGFEIYQRDISLNFPGVGSNRAWEFSYGPTLGVRNLLTAGTALDVYASVRLDGRAICVGGACGSQGTAYLAGVSLLW